MTDYAQWVEECPRCHNRDCLTVFQVVLAETGRVHYPESRLYPDGFDVGTDGSTEEEKVRCDTCGTVFDLADLMVSR